MRLCLCCIQTKYISWIKLGGKMKKYEMPIIKYLFYEKDIITGSNVDDFGAWDKDWFPSNNGKEGV